MEIIVLSLKSFRHFWAIQSIDSVYIWLNSYQSNVAMAHPIAAELRGLTIEINFNYPQFKQIRASYRCLAFERSEMRGR